MARREEEPGMISDPIPGIRLDPFALEHLPAAADLLARRVTRLGQADPAPPRRLETPMAAQAALSELWAKPHTTGVVAYSGDRLQADLIGGACGSNRSGVAARGSRARAWPCPTASTFRSSPTCMPSWVRPGCATAGSSPLP